MADLQKQRAVAEGGTADNTFAAADAAAFINGKFKIGFFNKPPPNRPGRTQLVFGTRFERFGLRTEIAGAQITISAHREGVDALDRRFT
jgi:hypothetical protein